MIQTLLFAPVDRIAHFESMFELENEAFGLTFPPQEQWVSYAPQEKERMLDHTMDIYDRIIHTFNWDALAVFNPWEDSAAVAAAVRRFGRDIFVGGMCGHSVLSIESIDDWERFSINLYENPETIHMEAKAMCERAFSLINAYAEAGADFVFIPNDIAFNAGPFINPDLMDEFIFPYLKKQVDLAKSRGLKVFLHTDGQIMPILERIISMEADCLQSIDPMAGMDIAEVKKITQGKLALMGNVQCSLLQDGPDAEIQKSAEYCLKKASIGGGYIFSTSNTIFPGMPLQNYRCMLDVLESFNQHYTFKENENDR
jgi:uroporphyrinogen decarboxylase